MAAGDRALRDRRERQALTYTLAQLVAVATHNPKKMPDFAKVFPDPMRKVRRKTPDEMLQAMRAWSEAVATATRH